jgi:ORF6N domain
VKPSVMGKEFVPVERIARAILVIRREKVMLDSDLAALYGVTTGNLNKAVKRNAERFPIDFMFQLDAEEVANLKFQFGISSWGGRRRLPYAFTEQGVAMRRVGKHDEEIAAILEVVRQLMAVPEKPRREIGFHVREKAPRYRVRKRA